MLKAETSRFARAMSTLVANTVPLVQSLGISARDLEQYQYLARALKEIAQGVKRGEGSPDRCAKPASFRRWPLTS